MEISKFEKSIQDSMVQHGWTREELSVIITLNSFKKNLFIKLTEHGFITIGFKDFIEIIEKEGLERALDILETAHAKKEKDYQEFRANYFKGKATVF